jgi:hypothetical protein
MEHQNEREFVLILKDWLSHQGVSYRHSDLAQKIGITPRHLNRVLQGTRNLSPGAQARALAAMNLASGGDSDLRRWLRQNKMTVAEFAIRLGRPQKTVEDWVYRGKTPSAKNRALVFSVTGLRNYDIQHINPPASTIIDNAIFKRDSTEEVVARQRARKVTVTWMPSWRMSFPSLTRCG